MQATFAINDTIHSTTGKTPHELVLGQRVQIPNSLTTNRPVYNYDNLAEATRLKIKRALDEASKALHDRKQKNKTNYDLRLNTIDLQIGDYVLIKKQTRDGKFDDVYEGPYKVEKIPSEAYIEIKKKNKIYKIHKNHVKKSNAVT